MVCFSLQTNYSNYEKIIHFEDEKIIIFSQNGNLHKISPISLLGRHFFVLSLCVF